MNKKRPTVADMLALKGKRQIKMLFVDSLEEAADEEFESFLTRLKD